MSYTPNQISETSAIGVNSDNVISGGNWSADTYTGTFELNDYAYVGVNLQVDEAGTLFFDFSQDGVNFSSYPVAGVDIASGINEVHTAWKGGRYFRVRFVGTGGRSFFRLKTFFSHHSLPLSAPLNQSIGNDQDATVVRSVGIGENPSGSYVNEKTDGISFTTQANLTNGSTFDSGILDARGFTQVQTHVNASHDGTMEFIFYTDSGGTDEVRRLTIPYVAANGFELFSAPCFSDYIKYTFTNDSGSDQTDFHYETKFLTKSLSGQVLALRAPIVGGMVANVGRSVIVGQDPNDNFVNEKVDGVAFRTEAALGGGISYVSPVTSTEGYSQIETHLFSDVEGTLVGRWYNDASKTTLLRTFTRPYSGDEVGTVSYFSAPVFGPYLEYTYTNGTTPQTSFFLDFHPRTKALSGQVLGMNDFIPAGVVANLGRNVIVGQDPAGNFRNVPTDTEGHLKINIHDPITAFGDLRTAEITPKVHLTFPYNINADIVDTVTANGGTVTAADSMAVVQTSAATNGEAEFSSRRVLTYRSGLGGLARFTALFTDGVASSTQYIGLGDETDGFFFGYDGTTFGILRRQNGVEFWTPQTSWNVDVMDGNDGAANPSNMLLDTSNLNVFQIHFQWLGAGQIEFSIEDENTGLFVPVHRIKYANANTVPSIYNANLPLHAHVVNEGNASNITIKTASMFAGVEGKSIPLGPSNNYNTSKSISTEEHLYHIRNKSSIGAITNRVRMILQHISAGNDANALATIRIYSNATLAGVPTWTDINGNDSVAEVDTVQTYSSGGRLLFQGVVGKDSGQTFDLANLDIQIVPNEIITITAEAGQAGVQSVALTWQEDY